MNIINLNGHEYINKWETGEYMCDGKKISAAAFNKALGIKTDKAKTPKAVKAIDGRVVCNGATLTANQAMFLSAISKIEGAFESERRVITDVVVDGIGGKFEGKPMTVGAMVSTLREKGLVQIERVKVDGFNRKYMVFTDLGYSVFQEVCEG